MLGRCWDWHWKNWYFEPGASATDPKGPDMSDPAISARVDAENWLLRTVRGGSGNSDKQGCAFPTVKTSIRFGIST